MEMWTEVRRRVLTGELSKRAACQKYGINWRTLMKMLAHAEPPGYRRKVQREKPARLDSRGAGARQAGASEAAAYCSFWSS